jgi:hypothetical protein
MRRAIQSRRNKWTLFQVIFLPFAGAIFFAVAVSYLYQKSLAFDAAKLINDTIAFMLGIVSMIISFWFSERYWRSRLEDEMTLRLRHQILYYLNLIARKIFESNIALDVKYREDQFEASQQRDIEVIANLRRIGDSTHHIIRISEVFRRELLSNDGIVEILDRFENDIAPIIMEKIAERPQIRPNPQDVSDMLSNLGKEIDDVVKKLRDASIA